MSNIRFALIVEPPIAPALSTLLEGRPFGLMPAGPRTILDRQLAALAAAGIREVHLLLAHLPYRTRDYVGTGAKWGLAIKCHSIGNPGRFAHDSMRLRRYLPGDGIAVGMEVFVSEAQTRAAFALAADGCTQYCDIRNEPLPFFVFRGASVERRTASLGSLLRIDSPRALWLANRQVLRQHGETLHTERNAGDGCFLGKSTRVSPAASLRGPLLLDTGVAVAAKASLGPDVYVGRDSMIEEGAEIHRSIIFDGTYVGPHAVIRDKIVDGGTVVDMVTGEKVYVDDRAIIGSVLEPTRGRRWTTAVTEWILALGGLAALAAPLVLQLIRNAVARRPCLERKEHFIPLRRALDGSVLYRKLNLWSVGGAWSRAPWFFAVLAGRLALVGSKLPLERAGESVGDTGHAYGMLPAALALDTEPRSDSDDADVSLVEYRLNAGPAQSWKVWRNWLAHCAQQSRR